MLSCELEPPATLPTTGVVRLESRDGASFAELPVEVVKDFAARRARLRVDVAPGDAAMEVDVDAGEVRLHGWVATASRAYTLVSHGGLLLRAPTPADGAPALSLDAEVVTHIRPAQA